MKLRDPEFPPLLNGHAVDAADDPLLLAADGTSTGQYGAGDLLWSRDASVVRVAIVLEPDVPLADALVMGHVMMAAIGDALGAIAPPNLALTYRWPFTILANGARVGAVSLLWPVDAVFDEVPGFLGIGVAINLQRISGSAEPGEQPDVTFLHEEGCGDIDRSTLIEAIARHFLTWADTYIHDGFRPVHQIWWLRADDRDSPMELSVNCARGPKHIAGIMTGLDEDGGILLRGENGMIGVSLAEFLGSGSQIDIHG